MARSDLLDQTANVPKSQLSWIASNARPVILSNEGVQYQLNSDNQRGVRLAAHGGRANAEFKGGVTALTMTVFPLRCQAEC